MVASAYGKRDKKKNWKGHSVYSFPSNHFLLQILQVGTSYGTILEFYSMIWTLERLGRGLAARFHGFVSQVESHKRRYDRRLLVTLNGSYPMLASARGRSVEEGLDVG